LSRVQAKQDRLGLIKWQRALDSLDALNAGGRVFYTVIPVDASTAIFTQGGGRAEKAEALSTATVTVSQYGRTYTLTGDGNLGAGSNIDGQARNGVFTFADLRSGEVTVNIKGGATFTEVSYVSNLTPDGGVANNGTVYVGNVIPLFNIAADATRNGIVKGRAHYEGDLTNAVEEPVTQPLLDNGNPTGARSPLVSAQIDVTRSSSTASLPYFHERFLFESNDEGVNSFGTPTRSGRIQRIAYESATTNNLANNGTLGANGSYSMIVPASAVGLPTILRFAEFATQRTHYRMEQGRTVVANERYLYGPNVTPSAVPLGAMRPTISIQTFQTIATVTANFTGQQTVAGTRLAASANVRTQAYTPATGGTIAGSGMYLSAPSIQTTAAIGSTATPAYTYEPTGEAVFGSAGNSPDRDVFSSYGSITLNGTAPTVTGPEAITIRRTDVFPNAGQYIVPATGVGSASGGAISRYIQILDGGFGFKAIPNGSTMNTNNDGGKFTGILPRVFFTKTENNGADASQPADRGYNSTTGGTFSTEAQAVVLVDYNATYATVGGTRYVSALGTTGGGVGTIQEILVTNAGLGYPSAPFTSFSFGTDVSVSGFANNAHLFQSAGNGRLRFNAAYATAGVNTVSADFNTLSFTNGIGGSYSFVPNASLEFQGDLAVFNNNGVNTSLAASTPNLFTVTIATDPANATTFGKVISVSFNNNTNINGITGNPFGGVGTNFLAAAPFNATGSANQMGIRVTATRAGNTLRATQTVTSGSTLDGNRYELKTPANITNYAGQSFTTWAGANSGKIFSNTDVTTGLTTPPGNQALTTQQLLAGNSLLVIFDSPAAGASSEFAWGVPVFETDRTSGGNSTGTLRGIRVINPGRGYSTVAGTAVNFHLVPNPWFNDKNPFNAGNTALDINAPAALKLANSTQSTDVNSPAEIPANISGSNIKGDVNTIFGYLLPATPNTVTNTNNANRPVIVSPLGTGTTLATSNMLSPVSTTAVPVGYPVEADATDAARLVFGGFPSGTGYVGSPRVVVFGGGLNLTEFDGTNTSQGGLMWFDTRLNSNGQVIGLSRYMRGTTPIANFVTANPVSLRNNTAFQLVSRVTAANVQEHILTFPVNARPPYTLTANTVTLITRVVDDLSEALTRQVNTRRGASTGLPATPAPQESNGSGVGGTANVSPEGRVTSVTFGSQNGEDGADMMLGTAYAAGFSQINWPSSLPGSSPVDGDQRLVAGPLVFIAPPTTATGVGATAVSFVNADPGSGALYRRIVLIRVTNPTTNSGYGIGNRWQRLNTLANIANPQQVGGQGNGGVIIDGTPQVPGQGAWVYGGSEGNGGLGSTYNTANQDNVRFDVFPGMTYTRDIHYGTGRELD
jgi:hypothetical protein